uniref:GM2 ganglioside activator n=1 Tax=Calidris pygmaea TaxID=425635 RepID=A0A8C3KGH2_9CHAR
MLAAGMALTLCALQLCPVALGGSQPPLLVERSGSRRLGKVGGFAWEDCGGGKDPVVLKSLSVAPDPISIPGSLRVSAAVSSSKAMASPLKGSYSLPASDFDLPDVELPAWMTNGNYRVRATVSSGGQELACVKLAFSLQSQ